ncbi:putative PurR-regulated permease PerM [Lactobacillus colini]|uniref:PurR-regulated permease PerM n=1 Tax=Lactobacillus colini TaxID=1819254 RepID=A0ABS4MH92_9LACO|nr:AI-2E family transporter [Lactobacillus colini]MBP2058711.1 putative PurR-regulated permease PerM [Lactobacillus colini]
MENTWNRLKQNTLLRRFIVLAVIVLVLYEARSMLDTILLTFIFTYLIVRLIKLVKKVFPKTPINLIVIVTYLLLLIALYFVITIYIPVLVKQVFDMGHSIVDFYQNHQLDGVAEEVTHYIRQDDIINSARNGVGIMVHALTSVGSLTVAIIMSLILSFFYTLELKQMYQFSRKFTTQGDFKWFFQDIRYLGHKFTATFGVVLEAQFFIALCNTVLTMIGLLIIGMPQIIALGLMIFVLSLIPVAGVIISLIPLGFVAYSAGGIRDVIYVVIMILIIHMIEAYILNPKFMSSKTSLPIFYTFLILLVAEKFWGTWGLILGVPIFTFVLDLIGIDPRDNRKKSKR